MEQINDLAWNIISRILIGLIGLSLLQACKRDHKEIEVTGATQLLSRPVPSKRTAVTRTLLAGESAEILETQYDEAGYTYYRVRAADGAEGYVINWTGFGAFAVHEGN